MTRRKPGVIEIAQTHSGNDSIVKIDRCAEPRIVLVDGQLMLSQLDDVRARQQDVARVGRENLAVWQRSLVFPALVIRPTSECS